jgi:erythromycin esterase
MWTAIYGCTEYTFGLRKLIAIEIHEKTFSMYKSIFHFAILIMFVSVGCSPISTFESTPTAVPTQSIPTSTVLPTLATPRLSETPLAPSITVAPEVSTWLRENAIPFDTTDPNSDFQDLMPLKELIGDARIVALGEATHGTHEFFEMKHRMLRFLVEEMGFNTLAFEANWPEANLVNDYVQTGQGDPAELLRGLYWTSYTQEVLDMIRWMRAHNENPGDTPLVSFFGFDMQLYTIAMDNVVAYVEQVDADRAAQTTELYHCFRQYSNRELIYAHLSEETRTACRANLQAVYDQVSQQQSNYEARSSSEEFERALQNARIVLQAEHHYGAGDEGFMLRDRYMAENVAWRLDQAGPSAKIVLWAHNFHISTFFADSKPMGEYLRERYRDQMVVFGFSFYQGSFNAFQYLGDRRVDQKLTEFSVALPPENSYEYTFRSAELPRFFLDLRGLPSDSPATNWLLTSHPFRHIGAGYDPTSPEDFFLSGILPDMFDVIIYFQDTSRSILLNR